MSKKHVHKYKRVSVNGDKIWACALSNCNHHMPKHYENLVEGKGTFCWNCEKLTVLDPMNMKHDFPWCSECRLPNIAGSDNDEPVAVTKELDTKTEVKPIDFSKLFK